MRGSQRVWISVTSSEGKEVLSGESGEEWWAYIAGSHVPGGRNMASLTAAGKVITSGGGGAEGSGMAEGRREVPKPENIKPARGYGGVVKLGEDVEK